MIEVRIPIPVNEYFQVRDDLEEQSNQCAIPIWMLADCVIRTLAGLTYFKWFEDQGHEVDYHIGWGEIQGDWEDDTMNAAVSHDFVGETHQPYVIMMFHDGQPVDEDDQEYVGGQRSLALMFKLAHGGA